MNGSKPADLYNGKDSIIIFRKNNEIIFNHENSEYFHFKDFCRRFRIPFKIIISRILAGADYIEALFMPATPEENQLTCSGRYYFVNGNQCRNFKKFCISYKVPYFERVKSRIRYGWNINLAFGREPVTLKDRQFEWENFNVITVSDNAPLLENECKLKLAFDN